MGEKDISDIAEKPSDKGNRSIGKNRDKSSSKGGITCPLCGATLKKVKDESLRGKAIIVGRNTLHICPNCSEN